ncbi:MAG: hypothetical protein K2X03_05865 [Bryobacteraceae bacterium]|nr:hypothetical protein [Bryobacteraceae bacterium]
MRFPTFQLSLAMAVAAMAAPPLPFERLGMAEGLSQATVRCTLQDRQGYLWFGTQDGLNRYDGQTFRIYRHAEENPDSLPNNSVSALLEDRQGTLWVATTGGGVAAFDRVSGKFRRYALRDNNASALLEDRGGTLCVATQFGGLHRRNGESFVAYPLPGSDITALLEDAPGRFTVATRYHGLFSFDAAAGRFTPLAWQPASPMVYSLLRGRNGTLYAGSAVGVSAQVARSGKFIPLAVTAKVVTAMWEDERGDLWLGGENGLSRVQPDGTRLHYAHEEADPASLSSADVRSLYVDRSGTYWVGTERGLNRFSPLRLRFASVGRGMRDRSIRALYESPDGDVWVGNRYGLDRLDAASGKFRAVFSGAAVYSIAVGRAGTMGLGTSTGLVEIGQDGTPRRKLLEKELIYCIAITPSGMWAGARGGLYRVDPATGLMTHYQHQANRPDSLAGNDVRAIEVASDGALWIGTRQFGVDRLDPATGRFTHFPALSGNAVYSLFLEPAGVLWVGTTTGLTRLDAAAGKSTRYTTAQGLPNDTINAILPAPGGQLWVSTNQGLSRMDTRTGTFRNYDVSHGLQDNEFNGSVGYAAASGHLSFGGSYGYNRFLPSALADREYEPPVAITEFLMLGEPVAGFDAAQPLQLSWRDPMIGFSFAALDYSTPRQLRYAYRMEGFDTDWRYTGRREATYTNLDPGRYTFRVRGTNSDGKWSRHEAAVTVMIAPPPWQRWWFRLLAVGLVAGALGLLYRRRMAGFRQAQATREAFSRMLLESQEVERKKIAGELHDSLGQNLSVIRNHALLGLRKADSGTEPHLHEIADAASLAIDEVREIATNLRPQQLERLGLGSALQVAVKRAEAASGIHFLVELGALEGTLASEDEIHLYRIVQEALSNILKHSQATEAAVVATRPGGGLRLEIRDNGRGFAVAGAEQEGLGLSSLAERARILRAGYTLRSAPGVGTAILLEIDSSHVRGTHSRSNR